jgi:hypothetical protein
MEAPAAGLPAGRQAKAPAPPAQPPCGSRCICRLALPIFWLAVAASSHAQSAEILSEFRRLDPFGRTVAADATVSPREILSPAVLRNGFASFHVAVSVPPKESYLLYVVTNPVDACRVAVYREHFVETAAGWVPDRLVELERLPDFGVMPDPDDRIEGQTTRLYLIDLWIPPDARTGRFRLEVQLKAGDWTVTPIEVRVLTGRIPDLARASGVERPPALPPPQAAADAAALRVWGDHLAGLPPGSVGPPATMRDVIRRNALQDVALAGSPGSEPGREAVIGRLLGLFAFPRVLAGERYLRLRDGLYAPFSEH